MQEVSFIQPARALSEAQKARPDWATVSTSEFLRKVSDPNYPCYFGSASTKDKTLSFGFVSDLEDTEPAENLANVLRAYLGIAAIGPAKQSLVVFVGPPVFPVDIKTDYHRFWKLLSATSRHDTSPWPDAVPQDTADPMWQWCFAGRKWFVLACSPAYRLRRSRNLGPCLTLIFQLSDRVFEDLGGSTSAGKHAKATIRRRAATFDTISVHPHSGSENQSSVFKWRQYFLPDDDTQFEESACPFGRLTGEGT